MLVCFDIGGSRIKAALSEAAGQVTVLGDAPTPGADFAAFVAVLAGFVPVGAQGVAISIAGCVDPEGGRLKIANIPCLDGRVIAADLAAALGVPVWIGNDADCFALAEAGSGAGVGHATVFGIILGTGVGGGLVMGGRIVTGPGGFAGEWGHGPVMNERPLGRDVPRLQCGCGQV
ncbi:MAG: ROK family protein, partial [Paracoccaceae bacterium]